MSRGRGITSQTKANIIVELNNGATNTELASKYRVSKYVVSRLKSHSVQSNILSAISVRSRQARRCRVQGGRFAHLENELLDWFSQRRNDRCALTTSIIKAKALKICDYLITQDPLANNNLKNFKASNGWFEQFKRRADIHNRSIVGTEDTIAEQVLIDGRQRLKAALSTYAATDIYNVDESGLCYLQMPSRSFIQGTNKSKEVKAQKERITLMLCCSLAGEKMIPVVIGKSQRPRALKNTNINGLPCTYLSNKKAWLTRSIFAEWVAKVNSDAILACRHICLVLDNFSGHVLDMPFSNVKVLYLPPGTTSVLQPLDCGIIHSLKCKYTELLSNAKLASTEENTLFSLNIKDAIHFVAEAWASVNEMTIRNCWRKANIANPTVYDLIDAMI